MENTPRVEEIETTINNLIISSSKEDHTKSDDSRQTTSIHSPSRVENENMGDTSSSNHVTEIQSNSLNDPPQPTSMARVQWESSKETTNYHDTQSQNTSRRNPGAGPSRRPATISELALRADIPWDEFKDLKYHLRLVERYRREGMEYKRSGDVENAFVELIKAATLVFERLPEHPDYNAKLNLNQRLTLGLNGQEILDNLAELRPGIVDRYEKWRQSHPDGDNEDTSHTTPNVRTQQLPNDNAMRESWIWDASGSRGDGYNSANSLALEEARRLEIGSRSAAVGKSVHWHPLMLRY